MKNLDDIKTIEKLDQARMRDILAGFPQQCREAFGLGQGFSFSANLAEIKNIVFSGMGGSAIGAEVVSYYLRSQINAAITVNRDYSLPAFVNKDSLVILLSYSGNTEETISAYQEAQRHQAKIIILTSGGQLADLAKRDAHPTILIPSGLPPRTALAFVSLPILAVFAQMHLIEDREQEVDETVKLLARLHRDSLDVNVPRQSNLGKMLAERFFDNFCIFYAASEHLSAVVTRWRGQLAENSKTISSSHVFPEMNHNEIVGWQHPQRLLKRFLAVILRDSQEHLQVKKRIEISKEILERQGIGLEEIWSQGKSLLARTFSLIYLGDYVSFYLAILNAEDPTPVKRIDYLKKRLKEVL